MKNLTYLVFGLLILGACSAPEKPSIEENTSTPLAETFMSQMWVKGESSAEGSADLVALMDNSIHGVLDSSIQAYDNYWRPGEDGSTIDPQLAQRLVVQMDTFYIEAPVEPYDLQMTIKQDTFTGEKLSSLRTYEAWSLEDDFSLQKTVTHYQPTRENIDPLTGEVRGWSPLFVVPNSAPAGDPQQVTAVRYVQPVVTKKYDDSQWYKENLTPEQREKLFKQLFTEVNDGNVTCYSDPSESGLLEQVEGAARLIQLDTQYIENPAPPYDLAMTIIEQPYDWTDVVAVEFVQDVKYYDNGAMEIDVNWYAPIIDFKDPISGKSMGQKPLFWVKCS